MNNICWYTAPYASYPCAKKYYVTLSLAPSMDNLQLLPLNGMTQIYTIT